MNRRRLPPGVAVLDMSVYSNQAHLNLRTGAVLLVLGMVLMGILIYGLVFDPNLFVCTPCTVVAILIGSVMYLTARPAIKASQGTVQQIDTDTYLARHLQDLQWPRGRFGSKPQRVTEMTAISELGIRLIADTRLEPWLRTQEVHDALIEPTPVTASSPVSAGNLAVATMLQGCLCILLVPAVMMLSTIAVGWPFGVVISLAVVIVMFWRTITRLPLIQRTLGPIPVVGRLVRPKIGRSGLVVGPGWARVGKIVWHAKRDLLLIRRVDGLKPESAVQLMFAGSPGRLCFMIGGTDDPMLAAIWRAWMHPEPRPELAMSDLSMSTR